MTEIAGAWQAITYFLTLLRIPRSALKSVYTRRLHD